MGSGRDAVTIGYFTVTKRSTPGQSQSDWTGGLLVLNASGRPLEFQCTLPLRPSRAHEILFGNSLTEHLISEVIGPTLLQKSRTPISLLCCRQIEALKMNADAIGSASGITVSSGSPTAIAWVDLPDQEAAKRADGVEIPELANLVSDTVPGVSLPTGLKAVEVDPYQLYVREELLGSISDLIVELSDLPDLVEPFERIEEAIREAQTQMARAA